MKNQITQLLQRYYTEYKFSIVRITVRNQNGDLCNGTGFHIGEGYIVTARHVVEFNKIHEIIGHFQSRSHELTGDIILPEDKKMDLALLKTNFNLNEYMSKEFKLPPMTPTCIKKHDSIPLSWYLSDMIGRDVELMKVLVFGFPRVSLSAKTDLVGITGEINAFIERYDDIYPYFIISVPPKGGYSGGPVISESGHVIGVITESLFKDNENQESGFLTVILVDVLLNFMREKNLNPEGYDEEEWHSPRGPGYRK